MNLKVGDKVRIKEDLSECEFGYCGYMEEFAGKETTVISTFGKGVIKLDIDEQVWDWSENVLELIEEGKTMKMKRIDYILNAKDNMQAILDETVLDCDICPVDSGVCNGDCEFYYKEYLNEEIEVDKSKLKLVEEVKRDEEAVNEFMEEYKKIVTETMELCIKKNKDYGSSVQDTFERFGDISYLVRITDKYNRICNLLDKEGEIKDEGTNDSIRDMANYLFLWLASRSLKEKK
jgi:hypothetical protein